MLYFVPDKSDLLLTRTCCLQTDVMATGWLRPIGRLIFIGHFPQKSPMICGSFAGNDLQLKAFYESSPPCTENQWHWDSSGTTPANFPGRRRSPSPHRDSSCSMQSSLIVPESFTTECVLDTNGDGDCNCALCVVERDCKCALCVLEGDGDCKFALSRTQRAHLQ